MELLLSDSQKLGDVNSKKSKLLRKLDRKEEKQKTKTEKKQRKELERLREEKEKEKKERQREERGKEKKGQKGKTEKKEKKEKEKKEKKDRKEKEEEEKVQEKAEEKQQKKEEKEKKLHSKSGSLSLSLETSDGPPHRVDCSYFIAHCGSLSSTAVVKNNIDLSPYKNLHQVHGPSFTTLMLSVVSLNLARNHQTPVREGLLSVQALRMWHKRWFVLYDSGILAYYQINKVVCPLFLPQYCLLTLLLCHIVPAGRTS